ncbi:CrcB family protein [candidate division KSB1 bacterium]|nr:CrcB family protein [candidate division KSB1 bacterium]
MAILQKIDLVSLRRWSPPLNAFALESRAFIFVGILGGFTTFSTFGNETMNLLREGENLPALINMGAHAVFGLAAVWLGRTLVHLIWR